MAMASPRPVATAGRDEQRRHLEGLLSDLVAAAAILGEMRSDSVSLASEITAKIEGIKAQIAEMLL